MEVLVVEALPPRARPAFIVAAVRVEAVQVHRRLAHAQRQLHGD